MTTQQHHAALAGDGSLAARVAAGDRGAFETIMRSHNGRLFRVARAIVRNDADAEDVLQDAYLQAYRRIGDYRGEAQLSTWLTRIVVNQALMRLRKDRRRPVVVPFDPPAGAADPPIDVPDDRAEAALDAVMRAETRRMLEGKIDSLPESFRAVFVLRDVEELSAAETAQCLSLPEATVRTRLFRARALLRRAISEDFDRAVTDVYGFAGDRCDRIVAAVLAALGGAPARERA